MRCSIKHCKKKLTKENKILIKQPVTCDNPYCKHYSHNSWTHKEIKTPICTDCAKLYFGKHWRDDMELSFHGHEMEYELEFIADLRR